MQNKNKILPFLILLTGLCILGAVLNFCLYEIIVSGGIPLKDGYTDVLINVQEIDTYAKTITDESGKVYRYPENNSVFNVDDAFTFQNIVELKKSDKISTDFICPCIVWDDYATANVNDFSFYNSRVLSFYVIVIFYDFSWFFSTIIIIIYIVKNLKNR